MRTGATFCIRAPGMRTVSLSIWLLGNMQKRVIVNLASKEYSRCIAAYLPPEVTMITCIFGEEKDGTVVEKGTLCKMARGEMVRFLAEHQVEDPTQMRDFTGMGYRFDEVESNENTYVFVARREKR